MIYRYKAFKGKEIVKGNVDAKDIKEAKEKLKKDGLRPINIEENIESANTFKFGEKFKSEELYILFRELSLLINSGINIENSLEILSSQFSKEKKQILLNIKGNIRQGISLSSSMENTKAFPILVINMVYVGENTSSLEKIFENLSNYYIKKKEMSSKIQETMAYPIILLITAVFVINFLIINVIPSFEEIFSSNDNILPKPTRILISFSNFLNNNYIHIILIITLIILIAFIYHKKNPEFFHKIFLKFKNYRMKETLKFTFNMDLLLGAGLTVDKSLKIISNMERNVILKKKYEKILKDIKSGESFSKSIEKTKVFPQILISMVHVGEESSNLKEIFSTMSKFYDEELSSHNKKFLGVLGPVLIIIMSIIIGFIVLSIALPIFDMVNQF